MTIPKRALRIGIVLGVLALAMLAGYLWRARPTSTLSPPAPFLKVALILPGPINDGGWNQAGYEGLQLIEKKLGAQVAYSANVSTAEAEGLFRRYAQEGFDLVIGNGNEYVAPAETVAKEFPRIKFAMVGSYAGNNRNLGALGLRAEEVGYLSGVVACLKTRTKKVAYIAGDRAPSTVESTVAFQRGVKAIAPSVQASVEWVGSWTDAEKARQIAMEQIKKGADVLVVNVNLAEPALKAAEAAGVYAIGWSKDQHHLAPRAVVTSALQRVPVLLLEGATLVLKKQWEGKQYRFGLREGAQDLAPFYGMLSPEEENLVNTIKNDVRLGKLDVTMPTELSDRKEGVR